VEGKISWIDMLLFFKALEVISQHFGRGFKIFRLNWVHSRWCCDMKPEGLLVYM
jgi:hypothetical protein